MGVYVKLVASVILWGGTWVSGRYLASRFSPFPVAFLRFALASGFLFFLACRAEGRLPRLTRQNALPLVLLGLTGIFIYNAFFFSGLKTTPAGRAALIVAAIPSMVSLYSGIFLKEPFPPLKILGVLLSFAGVAVIVSGGDPGAILRQGFSRGDLYIFGCVVSWTAYTIIGKSVMGKVSALSAVAWSCILGDLFLLVPALSTGLAAQTAASNLLDWANLVFLGVFATGYAFTWYYQGVKAIGPARAGVFINIVPVAAVILAYFILGEPMSLSMLAGGAMVLSGVWLTNRKPGAPKAG